jgi:uncharacterized membrane protein
MNILFWGLTVGVIGKVMVAIAVIIAHTELAHERRIDKEVLKSFRLELWLTFVGLLLILLGYGLEVYFYGFTPLLTCSGAECSAALGASQLE